MSPAADGNNGSAYFRSILETMVQALQTNDPMLHARAIGLAKKAMELEDDRDVYWRGWVNRWASLAGGLAAALEMTDKECGSMIFYQGNERDGMKKTTLREMCGYELALSRFNEVLKEAGR